MQNLQSSHSYSQVLRAIRFLSIRLKSYNELSELATSVNKVRTNLLNTQESWLQAVEERVVCSAMIKYLDKVLGKLVMELVRFVLIKTKNDRQDPFFLTLFPTSASVEMTPIASVSQNRYVNSLLKTLEENSDYVEYMEYKKLIGAKQKELEDTLEHREGLYILEAQAATKRKIAMDSTRSEYNLAYPRLQLFFRDDPGFVESFFAQIYPSKSADKKSD